jgi:hypothetical protein
MKLKVSPLIIEDLTIPNTENKSGKAPTTEELADPPLT